MKAVILAGGRGSRLAEETTTRPKPLVEIGGRPIIWHIMRLYEHHGIDEFIVCLGYKGYLLKEYFLNLALHEADVTIDVAARTVEYHNEAPRPWTVTLVDTGAETMTGGRLKRIRPLLAADEPFCMTYGDGISDVDVAETISFHRDHGLPATMTVVRPPARFGHVVVEEDGRIGSFEEKAPSSTNATNGGFFVLSPSVLDMIDGDSTAWEGEPLMRLAAAGQLAGYIHRGFWQPMDTLWERDYLEGLWASGAPPWKVWT